MKIALGLILAFILPIGLFAVTIPEASDVVLIYDNANDEQQGKYNYLYQVQNESEIFPCEASKCSTDAFRDRGTITMVVYKLPEGFPRVQGIADQDNLQDYVDSAEQQYVLENIVTDWSSGVDGRPYQLVHLYPDGTAVIDAITYNKPEINGDKGDVVVEEKDSKLAIILGSLLLAIVLVIGSIFLWRFIQRRRLRY
ncbi:MAG: hypothetical protein Q8P90_01140 [bacterium]|nr:hypothetical protein [bacterium]